MPKSPPPAERAGTDMERLFETEAPYVVRALRYFGVADKDLPDICQEVFLVVHRKLPEFEHRSSIRTWLFRICQRAASDYRKRAYVRREISVEAPTSGVTEDDGFSHRMEARRALLQALDHLDDDKRAVFVLFEIEGLSMKEVASVVECPLQTAYSRLHAARKSLAEALRDMERGVA